MNALYRRLLSLNLCLLLLLTPLLCAAPALAATMGRITYHGNGALTDRGGINVTVTVRDLENLTLPPATDHFIASGKFFFFWTSEKNGGNRYYAGKTYSFAPDTTLYAQWGRFRVDYYGNGGAGGSGSDHYTAYAGPYDYTGTVMDSMFSREGCVFAGWNTKADGSGVWVPVGGTVASGTSLTLYAQWFTGRECWLRFRNDSSAGPCYSYMFFDRFPAAVTLPKKPDTEDSVFGGWWTGAKNDDFRNDRKYGYAAGETVLRENTTLVSALYARREYPYDKFSKKGDRIYDLNGGSFADGTNVALVYTSYGDLKLYSDFSRPGYGFTGWNTEPDGSGRWVEEELYEQGDVLYAQWAFDPDRMKTVTFDTFVIDRGQKMLAAFYDSDGVLLAVSDVTVDGGAASAEVRELVYSETSKYILLQLDPLTLQPVADIRTVRVKKSG